MITIGEHKYRRGKKIETELEDFLRRLEKLIPVDSMVFLTARPPMPHGSWEDFAVTIVSSAFSGMPISERQNFLEAYWLSENLYAGLNGYTPGELSDLENPIIQELLEEGMCLKDTGIFEDQREKLFLAKKKKGSAPGTESSLAF